MDRAAMEIAAADLLAVVPVAAKAVIVETHAHRAVMAHQGKAAAPVETALQAKAEHRAETDLQVKVVDHAVMAEIAMGHAALVIVTAHVSLSATGWKSHATSKSPSSLKTSLPKLWPTTSATAAMHSACLMPHA